MEIEILYSKLLSIVDFLTDLYKSTKKIIGLSCMTIVDLLIDPHKKVRVNHFIYPPFPISTS